jgi:hypothetical protein
MTAKEGQIDFVFEYDPAYRVIATNGVWGGLTPRGDLKLDFFVESQATPDSVRHEVVDGNLGKEISRSPERAIARRLQVGVLLSIDDAENLRDFLKLKIEEIKKARGEG